MRRPNDMCAPCWLRPGFTLFAAAALVCGLTLQVAAKPVLPNLIGDHMVLQQGRPVAIWGWADIGEKITIILGSQTRSTITDAGGHWKVMLAPMTAGGPFTLSVRGNSTLVVKDVMVGEVWVLSGQSNMAFKLNAAENATTAIRAADQPQIRLFTVARKSALEPQQNASGAWQICTPEAAATFSAVGYFFGLELHNKLGVPVGLIHSSWPGTAAEEWVTPASLTADMELKAIVQQWQQASSEARQLARDPFAFEMDLDNFELLSADGGQPLGFSDFDDGSSRNLMHGYWTYDWQEATNTRLELVSPGYGGSRFAARVSGRLVASDGSFLRTSFNPDGSPADLSAYAGVRFYCRGKGLFKLRVLQPTISDWDDYATDVVHVSSEWRPVTFWFKDLKQAGWGKLMPFTPQALSGLAIEAVRPAAASVRPPSALYRGMIAPLVPYGIRGVAWYQGESNASRAYQYRKLLPALITGWRRAWQQADLDFLVVQLPNHGKRALEPTENAWAELREAQLKALALPHTGLAVTIDVGEADDVHPHKKAEVGHRLAWWALGAVYSKNVVFSGPLYDSVQVEGNKIRVRFQHVGSGLGTRDDAPLRGFAIAGQDRQFHWAEAHIDGDSVVVSSSGVNAPVAVRYAWAGNPDCNLLNKEGLPASPFRTDDWPGITAAKN
jgi:sialate O-acetylesterase